jgi:general secretion pathway protein F
MVMSGQTAAGSGRGAITLEHLVALNDEIAALVRTGLPLERGLHEVGGDLSGRLGATMTGLSERMSRGASLPEALAAEGPRLPRVYRAVVEAGLRAGRLPAALESLASFVRVYVDSRRTIGLALCYPLLVLLLAYGLFVLLTALVVPRFLSAYATFRIPVPAVLRGMAALGESAAYWGPTLPVLLLIGVLFWAWTGTSAAFQPGRSWAVIGLFPWMRGLLRHYEAANFADLLGLLIEHGVPYPEALGLAAEATGDRAVIRLGQNLAEAIERGEPPSTAAKGSRALPPLLRWVLGSGRQQTALAGSLHTLANVYRRRAVQQAEKIRAFLPLVLLLVIGLTATLVYGLSLFIPLATLLRNLAIVD